MARPRPASRFELPVTVPFRFFRVRYDGRRYPGSADLRGLEEGANCQQFAYELVRCFGRTIPDFRSSDLWRDTRFTSRVEKLRPLDLMLFNRSRRTWGAHVAVYLGRGRAIHLCKQIGHPVIWTRAEIASHERYRVYLGAKRARLASRHKSETILRCAIPASSNTSPTGWYPCPR